MGNLTTPDFSDAKAWKISRFTNLYYNPKTGDIEKIRHSERLTPKNQQLYKEVVRFWVGKAMVYVSKDGLAGGMEILPYNRISVIKFWGLINDMANWVEAVLVDEREWHILKRNETWEFDVKYFDDGEHQGIHAIILYLNNKPIFSI